VSTPAKVLKEDLLAVVPALRAVANLLLNDPGGADDLAEEALLQAWADTASFVHRTPLRIWLLAILHKAFYSRYPERRQEIEDAYHPTVAELPRTSGAAELTEFEQFRHAMQELPPKHREALILISGAKLSYEDAAKVCDCAVDAIVRRVDRARFWLVELLDSDFTEASARNRQSCEPSASNRSQLSRTQS
jgi:RNA polymerase sigma-70 factor (ECF subfamily)